MTKGEQIVVLAMEKASRSLRLSEADRRSSFFRKVKSVYG